MKLKAIFKLKEAPYNFVNFLTEEMAQKGYTTGTLPFTPIMGDGSVVVSHGFYSRRLSFEEWLTRYGIKIL